MKRTGASEYLQVGAVPLCAAEQVPVSFGESTVRLNFLVVEGSPLQIEIEDRTMEDMSGVFHLSLRQAHFTIDGDYMITPTAPDYPKEDELGDNTDSADFPSTNSVAQGWLS